MTRVIARIDTKCQYVVKGIQLEGVKKLYSINQLFKYLPEYLLTPHLPIDEIVLNDSVASLYGIDNFYLKYPIQSPLGIPLSISGGIKNIEDVSQICSMCERLVLILLHTKILFSYHKHLH